MIKRTLKKTILIFFYMFAASGLYSQTVNKDSAGTYIENNARYNQFYDSLKVRAKKKKFSSFLYKVLISEPKPQIDRRAQSLDYYRQFNGKIIHSIEIIPLNVFGPTFQDTAKKAKSWLERFANDLHTKSNLQTIKKMLLFKAGSPLTPELLYENERIFRTLPYIKDVNFQLDSDLIFPEMVNIQVFTKDRFSFGATGQLNGVQSGAFELYNQNLFGVGHEFSMRFVGHLQRRPYLGYEAYYKINNVRGKFIDFSMGYSNIYNREGFTLKLDKQFLTPASKWGYGASVLRLYRSERIYDTDPVKTEDPLNLFSWSSWIGKSFNVNGGFENNPQFVVSAALYHRKFYERPLPDPFNKQYFSNNTFYLAGLTFSQRFYIPDKLIYSYGITEDIPRGFKNELVYGYDVNEYGNRHYFHISASNGNFFSSGSDYFYVRCALGGYFKGWTYEQGMVQGNLNYISNLFPAGKSNFRFFARADYTLGIRRFEVENLLIRGNNHIRGFTSYTPKGKQRLGMNLEYVYFLNKKLYRFNLAFFSFADVGIIGSNKNIIFNEDYYAGIGLGLRLHNEYLVFKTIQLRLALYPHHPTDMNPVGFILEEQVKRQFYSFQPDAPRPMLFE